MRRDEPPARRPRRRPDHAPPAFRIGAALAIGLVLSGGGVVPGWGTAIGFLVGTGVGVLTYIVLDRTLPRVKPTAP
jgi:hypothetical protein